MQEALLKTDEPAVNERLSTMHSDQDGSCTAVRTELYLCASHIMSICAVYQHYEYQLVVHLAHSQHDAAEVRGT
jgi:hypothetical protein